MQLHDLLNEVAAGNLAPGEAEQRILAERETDLDFARLDMDRDARCGVPEVILSEGKRPDQIAAIARALHEAGRNVFATRLADEPWAAVCALLPEGPVYHASARCMTWDVAPLPVPEGLVAVVSAGTSDESVAAEAALTATRLGARVERVYDVGVAGIHRLARRMDVLRRARVIVVAAGMEGALPSVVGGLVSSPVIAVPTSIGYGAGFRGLTALLAMLNSCVAGITVVNIDNGFGAGLAAARINAMRTPEA